MKEVGSLLSDGKDMMKRSLSCESSTRKFLRRDPSGDGWRTSGSGGRSPLPLPSPTYSRLSPPRRPVQTFSKAQINKADSQHVEAQQRILAPASGAISKDIQVEVCAAVCTSMVGHHCLPGSRAECADQDHQGAASNVP